jgi:type IV pilus assembly protein PilB
MARQRLGEFLQARGIISGEELQKLLRNQRGSGEKLGHLLVKQGVLSENQLYRFLAEFFGLEYLELASLVPEAAAASGIPAGLARKQNIVPVFLEGNTLVIAASAPVPPLVLENLRRLSGRQLRVMLMAPEELALAFKYVYEGVRPAAAEPAALSLSDAPGAVELLDQILEKAVDFNASDVHLEPEPEALRVRFRVDGNLQTVDLFPPAVAGMAMARLKVMANMNIAERRAAQDGGFKYSAARGGENTSVSVRVATVPSIYGEKAVLRLQSAQQELALEKLGFEPDHLEELFKVLNLPHGIFLTTGPSGSGKTTTLYSALHHLRHDTLNIVTIEDPVEKAIKGITQTQIEQKYTYQLALRSILRQDPDVIMVGEIRDGDTARLALQAALTGHLVLSTLHTNDATGAVARLIDMGCEPFLVNATVLAVLAQRLVRQLCFSCRRQYQPDPAELAALGIKAQAQETFYTSDGCSKCKGLKYKGRIGIYELLLIDAGFKMQVARGADPEALREYALKEGMRSLRQDGILKIRKGLTSVAEVLSSTTEHLGRRSET